MIKSNQINSNYFPPKKNKFWLLYRIYQIIISFTVKVKNTYVETTTQTSMKNQKLHEKKKKKHEKIHMFTWS